MTALIEHISVLLDYVSIHVVILRQYLPLEGAPDSLAPILHSCLYAAVLITYSDTVIHRFHLIFLKLFILTHNCILSTTKG